MDSFWKNEEAFCGGIVMKDENTIEVHNITKTFKVYLDKSKDIKSFVLHSNRRRFEKREVLKGISFEVKEGEAIGLIGHNGCGKSTTLKLLTRIMYPDSGSIEIKGRVSSLIELGAGFHPDMSGRENIYINASIFGLSKKEIDKRVDEIIQFSELEDYIDNPVRTYSSGMYMRLAFSVAINVDADVLLIDEILAVGDIAFQAKCFNKLKEIKAKGTTIVIVSHSLGQIEQICEKSYWIHDGMIKMSGSPREVHPYYLEYMGEKNSFSNQTVVSQDVDIEEDERYDEKDDDQDDEKIEDVEIAQEVEHDENLPQQTEEQTLSKHFGSQEAVITSVKLYGKDGVQKKHFLTGESIKVVIRYRTKKKIEDAIFGIGLFSASDMHMFGTNTFIDNYPVEINGKGEMICEIPFLPLGSGEYKLDVAIHTSDGFDYDYWRDYLRITVYSTCQEAGILHMDRSWKHIEL